MLVIILLCIAIASPSLAKDSLIDQDDADDSMFGATYQSQISELGRATEESLNCFHQVDQLLATDWATKFQLGGGDVYTEPIVVNRFKDDEDPKGTEKVSKVTVQAKDLGRCMSNITKKVVMIPKLEKCMRNLVSIEIETEDFISGPGQFDESVPLPYLTFLDSKELVKLLFQNRTWDQLSPEEKKVVQVANNYLSQVKSDRDKVFVLDQACEWKNLAALQKHANNRNDQMKEFVSQVVRIISLKIARVIFTAKHLKPGTWISVYRRWVPVRMKNLRTLYSKIEEELEPGNFPVEVLCKYTTVLANYLAKEELKIVTPEKISPLNLVTNDLGVKISSKEERLCANGDSSICSKYRELRKSYGRDLHCLKSFGELLSNHFLKSIITKYANIEPPLTYPEIVCRRAATPENIAVRYCRCIGSICTFDDVGEVNANAYKLNYTLAVVTRV